MFPYPLRQINFKYRRVGLSVPQKHSHYLTVYMASYPERVKTVITLCGNVITLCGNVIALCGNVITLCGNEIPYLLQQI